MAKEFQRTPGSRINKLRNAYAGEEGGEKITNILRTVDLDHLTLDQALDILYSNHHPIALPPSPSERRAGRGMTRGKGSRKQKTTSY